MMSLIITEASVLIDVENNGSTDVMFELPFKFAVPDTLFVEELVEHYGHLPYMGLIIKTMSEELVTEAFRFHQKYNNTSVNNLLALILAKHENGPLLTDDKVLRGVASSLNIIVHSTSWLLEQMKTKNKIYKMQDSGSFVSWSEVEKISKGGVSLRFI